MTVKRLLQKGRKELLWVSPETLVYDAIKLMADHDVGALLVLHEGQIVGILTERDYLTKLILQGKHSDITPVADVMTRRVLYVEPQHSTEECMALMTERHVRHLPVVEDGQPIGMVSMRDVVADLIEKKEFMIQQLEHYIHGEAVNHS
jgi:CBS domain-containing protein